MPSKRREDKTKIASWLQSSQTQQQEDPYDSEADEMAPAHSADGSTSVGKPEHPAADWDEYSESIVLRLSDSKTQVRNQALDELVEVGSNTGE